MSRGRTIRTDKLPCPVSRHWRSAGVDKAGFEHFRVNLQINDDECLSVRPVTFALPFLFVCEREGWEGDLQDFSI